MNRSRWLSLGFVVLFLVVAIGVPAWKERMEQATRKYADGIYAAFALLCMGLVCIWWSDTASPGQGRATPVQGTAMDAEPRGDRRRSVKSMGWLLLVLSIVIAAADLIR